MNPPALTPEQLQIMKQFWHEEDEINGGMSNATQCILEIERLNKCIDDVFALTLYIHNQDERVSRMKQIQELCYKVRSGHSPATDE